MLVLVNKKITNEMLLTKALFFIPFKYAFPSNHNIPYMSFLLNP